MDQMTAQTIVPEQLIFYLRLGVFVDVTSGKFREIAFEIGFAKLFLLCRTEYSQHGAGDLPRGHL